MGVVYLLITQNILWLSISNHMITHNYTIFKACPLRMEQSTMNLQNKMAICAKSFRDDRCDVCTCSECVTTLIVLCTLISTTQCYNTLHMD